LPITTKVVNLNPAHSEVHSIQHYVIKLSVTTACLWFSAVSLINKTDLPDITEILLKVSLYIIF